VKLLIIEDSVHLHKSLGEGLRRSGFAVNLVEDGEAELRFALSVEYDVIVLDLMLPKLDDLTAVGTNGNVVYVESTFSTVSKELRKDSLVIWIDLEKQMVLRVRRLIRVRRVRSLGSICWV
jgi:chemotaxis response regulator CheB